MITTKVVALSWKFEKLEKMDKEQAAAPALANRVSAWFWRRAGDGETLRTVGEIKGVKVIYKPPPNKYSRYFWNKNLRYLWIKNLRYFWIKISNILNKNSLIFLNIFKISSDILRYFYIFSKNLKIFLYILKNISR